jgi:transcriptional regulator with GAF, ATPase, and Fis domain
VIISRDGQLRLELPDAGPAQQPASVVAMAAHPTGLMTEQDRRRRDRAMIEQALAQCGGKVFGRGGAAELLGVKPTTLASRIKRWGIAHERGSA